MRKTIPIFGVVTICILMVMSLSCSSQSLALNTTITREGSRETTQPPMRTTKPVTITAARPTETEHPPTSRITTYVTPTQTITRTGQNRPSTVTVTLPPTTVFQPPNDQENQYRSPEEQFPPYFPYYPPVVTVYPPLVTIYPPIINYYPPVYPQMPAYYGPYIVYTNVGPSFYYLPVTSSGHTVYFDFTVTGPAVYYWVIDPNNNVILLGNGGNSVYMSGSDTFTTATDGVYIIGFYSTQQGRQSTVTLNYSIY